MSRIGITSNDSPRGKSKANGAENRGSMILFSRVSSGLNGLNDFHDLNDRVIPLSLLF
jgi:hypothetical protein